MATPSHDQIKCQLSALPVGERRKTGASTRKHSIIFQKYSGISPIENKLL